MKEEEGLTLKEAPEYLDKRYSWQPKRPRIAVDWHHTLEIRNNVSGANRRALQKLEDAGYDIFLCSYSGPDRQKETDFLSDGVYSNWCGTNHVAGRGRPKLCTGQASRSCLMTGGM